MNRADISLGVYVHVPFCLKKCGYCDFYSVSSPLHMDAYLDSLLDEISAFDFSGRPVETIYFGGGTPTVLGAKLLKKILSHIRQCSPLSQDAEITCEANPATIGPEGLKELRSGGFNRLSVGVQSADESELKLLGRAHDFTQAVDCVKNARTAGFENLSLDLIYGLPGQSVQGFLNSCERVMELSPEHVSFYCLKLEEGTPMFKAFPEAALPDEDALFEMYDRGAGFFEEHGFEQYEISNFAKPGFVSRHNTRYWLGKDYIGFGPGAHSFVNNSRFFIKPDLESYASHKREICGLTQISPSEAMEEFIMLRLRLCEGIDPAEFERIFSLPFDAYFKVLSGLPKNLVLLENGRCRLTREGFFVSNSIISKLLDIQEE